MLADLFQGFGFWAEGWGLMWGVAFCVGVLAVLVKGFDIWTEVFGLWGVAFCWISSLYSPKGSGWKTEIIFSKYSISHKVKDQIS